MMKGRRILCFRLMPLIIPTAILSSVMAYGDVKLDINAVSSLREMNEEQHIVSTIRVMTLRLPQNSWEEDLVRAGERGFESVLNLPVGSRHGMVTLKDNGVDVLVGNWDSGQSSKLGISGFWIWDTPDYAWFVVGSTRDNFSSLHSTAGWLEEVLKWQFAAPEPLPLHLRYLSNSTSAFLNGFAVLPYAERGSSYLVSGIGVGSDAYVLLKLGKSYLTRLYPEGGAYVPERFPPLRDLVKAWSQEQILSEVGKMWLKEQPDANNNFRDSILISAAVEGGLKAADLESLLLPSNVPSELAWSQRVSAVLAALTEHHQIAQARNVIAKATIEIGSREDVGENALRVVFRWLGQSSDVDFCDLAVQCLKTCRYDSPPLYYLLAHGRSSEIYTSVKEAHIGSGSQALRDQVLREISDRIAHKGQM